MTSEPDNPIDAILEEGIALRVLAGGLKAVWPHVVRFDLAEDYEFPRGFLGAVAAGLAVHDFLIGPDYASCSLVWDRTELDWLDLRDVVGDGMLCGASYYLDRRIAVASVVDRRAVEIACWLGVAYDYPAIRPKVPCRLFVMNAVGQWIAHIYDDRGMDVACRNAGSASALRARCLAAGLPVQRAQE